MNPDAAKLAEVFKSASKAGVLEKPFREEVEKHLISLAAELKLDLVPRTEVTMGTSGRADTIYNRFIIEWEKPGSFKPSNHAATNTHAIAQVKDYGDSLFWRTREKAGRIVGCCTDGRYFIFVTKPERVWIAHDPLPVDEQSCSRFLDYFKSLQSGVALLPEYLSEDFSSENNRTRRTVKALYEALLDHAKAPALDAVFEQWAQFFGQVTEYEQWRTKLANEAPLRNMVKASGIPLSRLDLHRFFFATHTFFAMLTKLLACLIVGRYTDLPTYDLRDWHGLSNEDLAWRFRDLERGGPFVEAGIRNFLEGDFFKWYTGFFTPDLADCLRDVVKCLANYDSSTLDLAPAPTQDLLKKLYHRFVPPAIRKSLGEYYTPDWLAQRLLNMLDGGKFRGDPRKRLLDPACGSGTFLLLAIKAVRENDVAKSLPPRELLRTICSNIAGIDLNPLAVIAARTNYLLALGPLLRYRGREALEIPVYLADSIMTPSRSGDNLFEAERVKVLLSIGKVELPRRLATQEGVAKLTELLDRHLEREIPTPPERFLAAAKSELVACGADWGQDAEVLRELYSRLHELHAAGRNSMWARILKNAFAPVFLAPFDYIAGNPPWINWQNLPEGYRNETKQLWFDHGLFVHSGMDTILGKGKKDISMLMTYVAADSYLKDGGRFGFVITQSVFKTSGAGQGFRRFVTRSKKPLAVIFVDDFSEMQLFEGATNRTAVFIMRKGQSMKYPVQYAYWRKVEAGRKGGFDYDSRLEEVTSKTVRLAFVAQVIDPSDLTSPWVTGRPKVLRALANLRGESPYRNRAHQGVNTGGANAIYWFDILADHGDGTVMARNLTDGAKRKVESVRVHLEKDLLYPLLRGRDVRRWKATPGAYLLFVQDPRSRRGIEESAFKAKYPLAYSWLARNRTALEGRAAYKRYFQAGRDPFFSMFDVGEYTLSPWRVSWRRVANELDVAVVNASSHPRILSDSTLVEITCADRQEAHFVAGVMNSTLYRLAVASYIVLHPDIHILENLNVPEFNGGLAVHRKIAAEAARLSGNAPDASEPVHTKLDLLCANLWDVEEKALRDVQQGYLELYGPQAGAAVIEGEAGEAED
jgi:SAM-dependent methyltransferase